MAALFVVAVVTHDDERFGVRHRLLDDGYHRVRARKPIAVPRTSYAVLMRDVVGVRYVHHDEVVPGRGIEADRVDDCSVLVPDFRWAVVAIGKSIDGVLSELGERVVRKRRRPPPAGCEIGEYRSHARALFQEIRDETEELRVFSPREGRAEGRHGHGVVARGDARERPFTAQRREMRHHRRIHRRFVSK